MALAAGLAACQVNEDPAEGGFISGVTNLATGGYEERIDEREAELGTLEGEQSALELRAAEIRRQQAELDAEIASAEGQLATLRRRLADLRLQLAAAGEPLESENWTKLQDAEARVVLVQNRMVTVNDASQPVDTRLDEVAEIENVLAGVSSLVNELAGT
jgi:chromosome segregation ATPase